MVLLFCYVNRSCCASIENNSLYNAGKMYCGCSCLKVLSASMCIIESSLKWHFNLVIKLCWLIRFYLILLLHRKFKRNFIQCLMLANHFQIVLTKHKKFSECIKNFGWILSFFCLSLNLLQSENLFCLIARIWKCRIQALTQTKRGFVWKCFREKVWNIFPFLP